MEEMRKKSNENASMDQWLRQQYIKEANEIEQEVLQKEDMIQDEEIDMEEGYRKIMIKLQESGITLEGKTEMPDFTRAAQPSDKDKKHRFFMPKFGKVAAMAATVVLGTFTIAMTSQANRNYVMDTINYFIGNDVRIMISNDESRDISTVTEEEAMKRIQEDLHVQTPVFLYRPGDFEFEEYMIDETTFTARAYYKYNKEIITLEINASDQPTSLKIIPHGHKTEIVIVVFIVLGGKSYV